jgi:hypothetical protein
MSKYYHIFMLFKIYYTCYLYTYTYTIYVKRLVLLHA